VRGRPVDAEDDLGADLTHKRVGHLAVALLVVAAADDPVHGGLGGADDGILQRPKRATNGEQDPVFDRGGYEDELLVGDQLTALKELRELVSSS